MQYDVPLVRGEREAGGGGRGAGREEEKGEEASRAALLEGLGFRF